MFLTFMRSLIFAMMVQDQMGGRFVSGVLRFIKFTFVTVPDFFIFQSDIKGICHVV